MASVAVHGLVYMTWETYEVLQRSFSFRSRPTIELVRPETALKKARKKSAESEEELSVSKTQSTEVSKRKEWDEKEWQREKAEELKKFKTEAEKKIFLTYYEYLSLALSQELEYPPQARQKGIGGTVYLVFTLARDGTLKEWELRQGSGYRILDKTALEALRKAAPFSPLPKGLKEKEVRFFVPIVFKEGG
jgi:protein TonB